MTQATISVTADTSVIRRILAILDDGESDSPPTIQVVGRFVGSLNDNCREAVVAIARLSQQHKAISRTQLAQTVSVSDAQLNGVVGTIGKRWAQFIGGDNPFIGRRASLEQDWQYQIDAALAQQLIVELQAR